MKHTVLVVLIGALFFSAAIAIVFCAFHKGIIQIKRTQQFTIFRPIVKLEQRIFQ